MLAVERKPEPEPRVRAVMLTRCEWCRKTFTRNPFPVLQDTPNGPELAATFCCRPCAVNAALEEGRL